MMKNNNKQTKGRQKIEMKMIEDEEDRLVSFSKRRSGIYKKASELSTLCGAEIGIIVFSPTRKAFTYGTPSLEPVLSRYLHQNPPQNDTAAHLVETSRRARIHELNKQHNELVNELEAEKKRGEMLERTAASELRENKAWWEVPVDRLSMHDVKRLNDVVEELGKSMDRSMKSWSSSPSSELYPRSESNARPNPVAQLQPTHMFANNDVDHGEYPKHEDVYECGFH